MITPDQAQRTRELIATLRDTTTWPRDFVWNYAVCWQRNCGCAMSLAVMARIADDDEVMAMARAFGMPPRVADNIFTGAHVPLGKRIEDVTPEDIACQIEQWLAEQTVLA